MDRVDQEGVDLLETLTSKSVGDVGERILFDDIEAESDGAAAELTTTAPMVPSTVAPVLETTISHSHEFSRRKVTFVSKISVDLAFNDNSEVRVLSEPFHWHGADWTVLLRRHHGDLSNSDCYIGVQDTSALPRDFDFTGKAKMRLLLEDSETPVRESTNDALTDSWFAIRIFHTHQGDRADQGFNGFIRASDSAKLEQFQAARQELSRDDEACETKHNVYIEVTIEREFKITRPNLMNYDSKVETGMVGITNQGATCYLNALLQMLFHVNFFRRTIFAIPHEEQPLGKSTSLGLQTTFKNLQFSRYAVDTKSLTDGFGWNSLEAFQQQDVQEMLRVLMDRLEEIMKGTVVDNRIIYTFGGSIRSYIQCTRVPYVSKRVEDYYDINLNVKGFSNLLESFRNYTESEMLEGENAYDAGEVHGKQDARKGVIFTKFPPVLTIHLKRFDFDLRLMNMRKIHDNFAFPSFVNLDEFLAEDVGGEGTRAGADVNDSSTGNGSAGAGVADGSTSAAEPETQPAGNYVLHSVLVHAGDYGGGHYFAYIRPGHHHNYADSASEAVQQLNDAKARLQGQLRRRLLTRKHNATSVSTFGATPSGDGNKRSLADSASDEAAASSASGDEGDDSEKNAEMRIRRELNDELYEEMKDAGRGGKWFKFDDEHVYEVQEEEAIDFNFGRGELNAGFSSAYMLLYVRADAVNEIMAPIRNEDIPSSLVRRLSQEQYVSRAELHANNAIQSASKGCHVNLFTEANLAEFDISTLKLANRNGSSDNDFHGFQQCRSIPLPQSTTMRHVFYSICTQHLNVSPVQVRLWLEVKDSGKHTFAHRDTPTVRRLGCPLTMETITSGQPLEKWIQSVCESSQTLSTIVIDTVDEMGKEKSEALPLLFDAKLGSQSTTVHLYAEILPSTGPLVGEDVITKRATFEATFASCREREALWKAKVVRLFSKFWECLGDGVKDRLQKRVLEGLESSRYEVFGDHDSTWAAMYADLDADLRQCGLAPEEGPATAMGAGDDGGTATSDYTPAVQALINEVHDIEETLAEALVEGYPRLQYGHRFTAVKLFDATNSVDARELYLSTFCSPHSVYPQFETTSTDLWWCDNEIANDDTENEFGVTNKKIAQCKQQHRALEERLDPKSRYLKFLAMLYLPCPDMTVRKFLRKRRDYIATSVTNLTTHESVLGLAEKLAIAARNAYMRDLDAELHEAIKRCGVDTSASPWLAPNVQAERGSRGKWKLWISQGIAKQAPLITVEDAVLYFARVMAGMVVERAYHRKGAPRNEDKQLPREPGAADGSESTLSCGDSDIPQDGEEVSCDDDDDSDQEPEPLDVTEHPFLPLNHHGGLIVIEPVITQDVLAKALAAQPAPAQASTVCTGAEHRELILRLRADLHPNVVRAVRAASNTGLSIDTCYADWVVWLASRMVVRIVPLSPAIKKALITSPSSSSRGGAQQQEELQRESYDIVVDLPASQRVNGNLPPSRREVHDITARDMKSWERGASGLMPAVTTDSMGERVGGGKFLQQESGLTYYDVALRIGTALNVDPATIILHPMTANITTTQASADVQVGVRDVHDTARLVREVDKGDTDDVSFVQVNEGGVAPVVQVEIPRYKKGQLSPTSFDYFWNIRSGYMRAGYENDVSMLTSIDQGNAHVALKQRGPCDYRIYADLAQCSDALVQGNHRKQQAEDDLHHAFLSHYHMLNLMNMRVRVPAFAYSLSPYPLVSGQGTRLLANMVALDDNDLNAARTSTQQQSLSVDPNAKRLVDVKITDERLLTWRRVWLARLRDLPAQALEACTAGEREELITTLSSFESPQPYLHGAATYSHTFNLDAYASESVEDSGTVVVHYDPHFIKEILQAPPMSRNLRSNLHKIIIKMECGSEIHEMTSAIATQLGIPMNHVDVCAALHTSENTTANADAPSSGSTPRTDGGRWAHFDKSHMLKVFSEGHTGRDALSRPFKSGDYGAPDYTLISSVRLGQEETPADADMPLYWDHLHRHSLEVTAREVANAVNEGLSDRHCTSNTRGFPMALLHVASGYIKGILSPYDTVEHAILSESDVFEYNPANKRRGPWAAWPSTWSIHAQYVDPAELPFLQNTHPTVKSMIVQVCSWTDQSMPGYRSALSVAETAAREGGEISHGVNKVLHQAFNPECESKIDFANEDSVTPGPFLTYIREDDTYDSFARRVMAVVYGGNGEAPLLHCVDPWHHSMVWLPRGDSSSHTEGEEGEESTRGNDVQQQPSLYSVMADLHPVFAKAPLWHARDIHSLLLGPYYSKRNRETYRQCNFGDEDGGKSDGIRSINEDLSSKFLGLDGVHTLEDWKEPIFDRYKELYDPSVEDDQLRQFPTIAMYSEEHEGDCEEEDDNSRHEGSGDAHVRGDGDGALSPGRKRARSRGNSITSFPSYKFGGGGIKIN